MPPAKVSGPAGVAWNVKLRPAHAQAVDLAELGGSSADGVGRLRRGALSDVELGCS